MEHRFNLKPSGTSCILKVKRHTCRYCFYSCAAKIYSREITLFFLYFFCPLASISPPTPCVPQERLLKLFIYREEEVEGQDILFSVRFGKIILIMILLTKGRMWLLKMDLWKNSYPQKNICRRGMTTRRPHHPPPAAVATLFHPLRQRVYSLYKFNSRAHICVLKASKSEIHNPRPQVPLHVPSRLHSCNFEIVEAALIWRGINLPSTCIFFFFL